MSTKVMWALGIIIIGLIALYLAGGWDSLNAGFAKLFNE